MSDPIETTYPIYNQYIYKQGIGWVLVGGGGGDDSLPDQTNNAGKFLTTDGTVASWGAVTPASIGALPDDTTAADIGAIPDTHPIMPITQADINKWNSDEVFIATYGTTTFSEVQTAYNAGKAIFVKNTVSSDDLLIPLTVASSLQFTFKYINTTGGNSFSWYNLTSLGWNSGSSAKFVDVTRTINTKALSADIVLSASDVGAIPDSHVVNGITAADISNWNAKVSDDHKWNDVELDKVTSLNGSGFKIPVLPAANSTTAYLVGSGYVPTANYVAAYDSDKYLHSTTPSANDASNKVATTDFVSSALSTIEGVPSYGASDTGKVLKTDGVSAYWASIDSLLEYKGVKATAAALPTIGNTTGDVWIVEEDNSEYVWNGTTWEKFGPTIDLSGYVPTSRTVNGKVLTNNITLNYSDVGALADTVPAAGITNADITAWNSKPSVDELVKVENAHGVNRILPLLLTKDYYSAGNWKTTAYSSNRIAVTDSGTPTLYINNSNNDKYATYQYDSINLANGNHAYTSYIYTSNNLTANASYALPSKSGTLALTSQIPTSLAELTNDPGYAIITIRDWTSAS